MGAVNFDNPNDQLQITGEPQNNTFQDTWDTTSQPSNGNFFNGVGDFLSNIGLGGISDRVSDTINNMKGFNTNNPQSMINAILDVPSQKTIQDTPRNAAGITSWMMPSTFLGKGLLGLLGTGALRGLLSGLSQKNATPTSVALSTGIGTGGGILGNILHPIQTAQNEVTNAVENSPAMIDMNAPLTDIKEQLPDMATASPYKQGDFNSAYANLSNWLTEKISGLQPGTPVENIPENPIDANLVPQTEEAASPTEHAGGQVVFEGGSPGEYVRANTPGAVRLGTTGKYILPGSEGTPIEIPPTDITTGAKYAGSQYSTMPPSAPVSMTENQTSKILPIASAQKIKRLMPYMPDLLGGNQIVANAFGNPNATPGLSIPAAYYSALSQDIGNKVPGVNFWNGVASGLHTVPNAVNSVANVLPFKVGNLLEMLGGLPLKSAQSIFPATGSRATVALPYLFNLLGKL